MDDAEPRRTKESDASTPPRETASAGSTPPDGTEDIPEDRCGHPTQRGGLCKNHPMANADRCHHHAGLEPTAAERRASRQNPIKHGYFAYGFLKDEERELFQAVLDGDIDPVRIKNEVIAGLIVRAARMTRWESEGEQVSGFTTDVFHELRKSLEAIEPDELEVQHSWDDAELAQQVQRVLREKPDVLLQVVPPEVRDAVEHAL